MSGTVPVTMFLLLFLFLAFLNSHKLSIRLYSSPAIDLLLIICRLKFISSSFFYTGFFRVRLGKMVFVRVFVYYKSVDRLIADAKAHLSALKVLLLIDYSAEIQVIHLLTHCKWEIYNLGYILDGWG